METSNDYELLVMLAITPVVVDSTSALYLTMKEDPTF